MDVLVAGQDPAGAAAVARVLGPGAVAASVGSDGLAVPLDAASTVPATADGCPVVYVLDSCVPSDTVDEVAVRRLQRFGPVIVVATGADVYPDAAGTRQDSGRRLSMEVLAVEPGTQTGFDEVRRALATAPNRPCAPAAREASNASPQRTAALERADRAAYLRTTIARVRAAMLAETAQRFRIVDDEADADTVRTHLDRAVDGTEHALRTRIHQVYRGTFAGWDTAPVPAPVVLPRPEVPDGARSRRRPENAAVLVLGASAGLGIGRAVAAPLEALGPMRWFALPISLAIGLAAAVWLLRVRTRSTARAGRKSWADAAASATRQRVEFELAAALVAAESDASLRLARGS